MNRERKKINILYMTGWGDLNSGGPISLLGLLRKLDRERFNPMVAVPSHGTLVDALKAINIEVEIVKTKSLKRLHIVSFVSSVIKLVELIKEKNIDIVHSNAACSRQSFTSAIAAKIRKIPFIYHVRILDSGDLADRILVKLSTRVVTVSDAVSNKFYWIKDSRKVIKIYNGVDMEEFNPAINREAIREEFGLDPRAIVIGAAGMLAPVKGLQYFLRAASQLSKIYPDMRFLIAGAGVKKYKDHKAKLKKSISLLGLNGKVIFTGFRRDFPWVLAGIDIFVVSSIREAFSRVLLEAMAMEKPIVATRIGGMPEIVENGINGILIPPRDPSAIADTITNLINDKKRARQMGLAGRIRATEFFDIKIHVRNITNLYLDLTER